MAPSMATSALDTRLVRLSTVLWLAFRVMAASAALMSISACPTRVPRASTVVLVARALMSSFITFSTPLALTPSPCHRLYSLAPLWASMTMPVSHRLRMPVPSSACSTFLTTCDQCSWSLLLLPPPRLTVLAVLSAFAAVVLTLPRLSVNLGRRLANSTVTRSGAPSGSG